MKISKNAMLLLVAMVSFFVHVPSSYGAHNPAYPVYLKDANALMIYPGNSRPYSPKQTCFCHNYESDAATVMKDHGPGTSQYSVVAPQHGVSAGYHFQQGRNIAWNSNNNNAQRSYYGLATFTSSPGMYGKY